MSIDVIGVLELSSMADGFFTLDAIVKEAPVTILKAEAINPGKYLIIISGDVASVEASMNIGISSGGKSIVDYVLLKNLDDKVLPAISACIVPEKWDAIGFLETKSVVSAVEAADMSVKAANVQIIGIHTGNETGGKAMVKICGAIGNINTAMDSAVALLTDKDQLYRDVIIPGPHSDIKGFVCGN